MVWAARGGDRVNEINWICGGRERKKGVEVNSLGFFCGPVCSVLSLFPKSRRQREGIDCECEGEEDEEEARGAECYSMDEDFNSNFWFGRV